MSMGMLDHVRALWRRLYPAPPFKGLCHDCGDLAEQGDKLCRPCSLAMAERYEHIIM